MGRHWLSLGLQAEETWTMGWAGRRWRCLLFTPSTGMGPAALPLAVTILGLAGTGLSCCLGSGNSQVENCLGLSPSTPVIWALTSWFVT